MRRWKDHRRLNWWHFGGFAAVLTVGIGAWTLIAYGLSAALTAVLS